MSEEDKGENSVVGTARPLTDGELLYYRTAARKGFMWLFSTTIIWQVFSWFCTVFTVRILRPDDYGLVALPDAVFPYLMMLATLKLDTWMMQEGKLSEQAEKSIASFIILLSVLSTGLGLVAAPLLARFYGYGELESVAQVMCLMFLPRGLRLIPEVRLRQELNLKPIAISNLSVGVVRGLFQVYLAAHGWGAWTLIWGAIFAEVALLVWLSIAAGQPRGLSWDQSLNARAFKFGCSATLSTIFWVIFSTADNLVVGKLFGKEALGFYATAFLLTDLPLSKINTVLSPVLYPYYTKLKHNPAQLYSVFMRTNKTLVALVAPALVGLAVVAPDFVPLVFGDQWQPMVLPLQVMCLVGVLRSLTANVSSFLFALGEPGKVLGASIIAAITLPAGFAYLGSTLGMSGIYLTWLLIYPIVGPWLLFRQIAIVTKTRAVSFLKNFAPVFISVTILAVLTAASASFLRGKVDSIPLILLETCCGILVYASVYRLLFSADFYEALALLRGLKQSDTLAEASTSGPTP